METIVIDHPTFRSIRWKIRHVKGIRPAHREANITVPAGRVHAIDAKHRQGDLIRCVKGVIWLTRTGDFNDYRLQAGDVFVVDRPGRILVYALKDAGIEVASPRNLSG